MQDKSQVLCLLRCFNTFGLMISYATFQVQKPINTSTESHSSAAGHTCIFNIIRIQHIMLSTLH